MQKLKGCLTRKVGDYMAYYGAQENKEKVEVMSAEQTLRLAVGYTSNDSLESDGTLDVLLEKNWSNKFYANDIVPTKIKFTLTGRSIRHSRHCVVVSKRMGTSGKISDFISMSDKDSSQYTVKFLNNPDITNWTRLYIDVYKDDLTVCVRVDGC